MHPVDLLQSLREEVRHRRYLKELKECGEDGSCGCECSREQEIHHPELEVEDGQLKVEFPIADVNIEEDYDWDDDDHPEIIDPDMDGDIDVPCDEIHVEDEMEPEDEFPISQTPLQSNDMLNGDPAVVIDRDDEPEKWTSTPFSESIKRVKVVRNGKSVIKFKTDKPGFKIAHKDGRPVEVKMSSKELSKRKRIGKTFARKSHSSSAKLQRAKSTKKHTW